MALVKVDKRKAKKAYDAGKEVTLLPCKVRMRNKMILPVRISNESGATFEASVNAFEYYNCNRELGSYAHFFIDA